MSTVLESGQINVKQKSPTNMFCKKILLRQLSAIEHGRLVIHEGNETHVFGDRKTSDIHAEIFVHNSSAYPQILFGGSIGAGESFMSAGWSTPDLPAVMRIFARNMSVLDKMDTGFNFVKRILTKVTHLLNANTEKGSKRNISAHYDLNNEFFKLFLDSDMMYSSAIFNEAGESLEHASRNKLERICQQLQLSANDHLLEIGTGWGGMAIHAAKYYGCKVTTTTISEQQHRYAKQRIEQEGLQDKITLLFEDYRNLTGSYDKLVSIEMIEAVGHKFLPAYFQKCSSLLKEDGLMLIQAITIPDQRYDFYTRETDFIKQYIFPGGHLPSLEIITQCTSKKTDLQLVDLKDIGFDYALTLQEWRERFFNNIHKIRQLGYDESFIRMWDFYFCYCEGGFLEQSISTSQILFAKPKGKKRF